MILIFQLEKFSSVRIGMDSMVAFITVGLIESMVLEMCLVCWWLAIGRLVSTVNRDES